MRHLGRPLPIGKGDHSSTSTSPPPAKTEAAKPAQPAKLNLVRFRGKTGKPSTNVKVSTRAGNQSAIRIVAIAPGNEGITFKPQPRLWWHQNEPTEPGELEFVLTRFGDGTPSEVLRRPIPMMKAGYNVIDLSNRNVNPDAVAMENGIPYQWTINVRSGATSSPVYSRLTLKNDPNPATPNTPVEERLRTLGRAGELV